MGAQSSPPSFSLASATVSSSFLRRSDMAPPPPSRLSSGLRCLVVVVVVAAVLLGESTTSAFGVGGGAAPFRQHSRSGISSSSHNGNSLSLSPPWRTMPRTTAAAFQSARRASSLLRNRPDDGDDEEQPSSSFSLDKVKERWDRTWEALPAPLVTVWQAVVARVLAWRWHVLSFAAGAVLTVGALLVPLYATTEAVAKPVTLFETILGDLQVAYVDPVDTDKLFETGVQAMLRSLDPYTEFETAQEAVDLTESIDGKYAGVGLVITGSPPQATGAAAAGTATDGTSNGDVSNLPNNNQNNQNMNKEGDHDDSLPTSTLGHPEASVSSAGGGGGTAPTPTASSGQNLVAREDNDDEEEDDFSRQQRQQLNKARQNGIRVVNAFEGYAFDYGLRVGDKLVAIDDQPITADTSVDQVRMGLRGEPGTLVSISFEREGVAGVQTVTMPRQVVRIDDVKLATLVGNPTDGIGYIQLSGFASDAGREVRQAILALQRAAEDASGGERSLQGLVLDLRGNPGGLLTSAVDVASLLVPRGSDIVSARGRGFPGILYRSRVEPLLDTSRTKLAVLVNGNTASAAEIVSGAIQDLDVGVIVGGDRTFGKGLVQNVEELPFNSALKFTVAKYYTPSGRCIQGITYTEGGGKTEEDARFVANKVAEKDKNTFYTRMGRAVRDGGGIEVDYKVEAPKASALEVTLLRSGLLGDFAAEWSKQHELTDNFRVDEETYRHFQAFVAEKQRSGEVKLEALYGKPLSDLKSALKKSGYKGSEKMLQSLQTSIIKDMQRDFDKYSSDIKEDISQSILARYLPESMLIERGLKLDKQVQAAVKLVGNGKQFDSLLAKGSTQDKSTTEMIASSDLPSEGKPRLSGKVKW